MNQTQGNVDRRAFLRLAAATGAGAVASRYVRADSPVNAPSTYPSTALSISPTTTAAASQPAAPMTPTSQGLPRHLARFPEKTDLYLITDRPPQLETPIKFFQKDLTPNEAFFVRWHLAGIPTEVDTAKFRLNLAGHVNQQMSWSLDDLKKFEPVSLIAVAQCSGNSRGFFSPRVLGGQWGNGAMGNAKWTGVRLSDLLDKAGVKGGAAEVSFSGLDIPPVSGPEHFVKSLNIDHALDGEVMVAYAMNDAPLPMLNGFPIRLIVPGWYATYWVKALNQITVLNEKFKGFWMDKAYRIPKNPEADETPQNQATDTVPINKHTVRSIFVQPESGATAKADAATEVQGIAFDWGAGITRVDVSTDDGATWTQAKLDPQASKYAWRRWRYSWTPNSAGQFILQCKATNSAGETQVTSQWNHSGYERNVIERLAIQVV